jgi:uncharacterized membrane protein
MSKKIIKRLDFLRRTNIINKKFLTYIQLKREVKSLKYTKLTLVIVGIILLIMGIAGLPGVSDMGTEPDWHAILKIVIGIVAVIIALMEKE